MNQDPPYLLLYCINTGKKRFLSVQIKRTRKATKK